MCIVRDGDDLTGEDVCPLLKLQKNSRVVNWCVTAGEGHKKKKKKFKTGNLALSTTRRAGEHYYHVSRLKRA